MRSHFAYLWAAGRVRGCLLDTTGSGLYHYTIII